ncbi:hypothetical protein, partial [Arhodomonas sp. SL1]|uniref:hypothetical protein n=1 Tax=Arhodomonas sp. SL1 TaxID=3425691 RepID=UPI003F883921
MRAGPARDLLLSVAIHVFAIVALGLSFSGGSPPSSEPAPESIQAVTVDETRVEEAMEELERAEQEAEREREAELERLAEERRAEEERLAELERQRQEEAERQRELE